MRHLYVPSIIFCALCSYGNATWNRVWEQFRMKCHKIGLRHANEIINGEKRGHHDIAKLFNNEFCEKDS